jgi:hypothetical protein
MGSFFATGTDAERVAEYRKRAEDMYGHAAEANDTDIRSFYMQIAIAYTGMAKHLESRALSDALQQPLSKKRNPGRMADV